MRRGLNWQLERDIRQMGVHLRDVPRYVAAEARFRTLASQLDRTRLEAIRHSPAVAGRNGFGTKYLKSDRYVREKLARALELGLHQSRGPLSILDLGCGPGYFIFVCERLGHVAMGLDIPDPGVFSEITEALGVKRIGWRIWAGEPLPASVAGPFDLITSFSASFHQHGARGAYWDEEAWEVFLSDVRPRVVVGGRLYLRLNMGPYVTVPRYRNVESVFRSAPGLDYRRVNHRTALFTRTA